MITAQTLERKSYANCGIAIWTLLREDIGCVKARDPAARHTLEIVLTYPGAVSYTHLDVYKRQQ